MVCGRNPRIYQFSGTCWYHNIMNAWLLSAPSRQIMKRKLIAFKHSHEMKPFTNIGACPMRGKLPVQFWSYVEYLINYIEFKNPNNSLIKNIRHGKQFQENKIIEEVFARNKTRVSGGLPNDVYMFLDLIFPGNWSKTPGKDIYVKMFEPNEPIKVPEGYKLCHAHISGFYKGGGHGIAGLLCGGKRFIYDSNRSEFNPVDWLDYNSIKKYFDFEYAYPGTSIVHRNVVFVKLRPTQLYAPPTYLNRTKINIARKNFYTNRSIQSITNKHNRFDKNTVKIYPKNKVYTNEKLNEFIKKMSTREVLKSGILKQYTVAGLQRLTGLKTTVKPLLVSKALANIALRKK